ncbi:MAG: hypothetical protein ACYCYO_01935 [Bacilli bacterium]
MKRFNEWIAVRMTLAFGTMAMVYLFLFWSLLPLIYPPSQNIVFYTSSGVIQLVALPAIMVGQIILGRKAERRAQQDHEAILAEFAEIKAMHASQTEELRELREINKQLSARHERLITGLERVANPRLNLKG